MKPIIKNKPIDIEICELLGDKSRDFLVLTFDGVNLDFFGTPPDSPREREIKDAQVKDLNDRSESSLWPAFFLNWQSEICRQFGLKPETTSEEFHPAVGYIVSRVCAAYSEYSPAAIQLLETIEPLILSWTLTHGPENATCRIIAQDGESFGTHEKTSEAIAIAVLNFLRHVK